MLYLATPYTKGGQDARLARFNAVTHVAAQLIEREKIILYSPITMTHPIDLVIGRGDTLGSDFWTKFDEAFMAVCTEIRVLTLPGWEESRGVQREIEFFGKRGIQPQYLDPSAFGIDASNSQYRAAFF